jgi:hypothetical protein
MAEGSYLHLRASISFPGVSKHLRMSCVCCRTWIKASSSNLPWSSMAGGDDMLLPTLSFSWGLGCRGRPAISCSRLSVRDEEAARAGGQDIIVYRAETADDVRKNVALRLDHKDSLRLCSVFAWRGPSDESVGRIVYSFSPSLKVCFSRLQLHAFSSFVYLIYHSSLPFHIESCRAARPLHCPASRHSRMKLFISNTSLQQGHSPSLTLHGPISPTTKAKNVRQRNWPNLLLRENQLQVTKRNLNNPLHLSVFNGEAETIEKGAIPLSLSLQLAHLTLHTLRRQSLPAPGPSSRAYCAFLLNFRTGMSHTLLPPSSRLDL